MEKFDLDLLNKAQKAAVLNTEGYLRIIAGAGSGKTRVITQKIIYLIEKLGIKPYEILAVTFTNKAAKEMLERVAASLDIEEAKKIHIATFHAICSYILRIDISNLGISTKFEILDYVDQKAIVSRIFLKYNKNSNDLPFYDAIEYISKNKNQFISPAEALKEVDPEDETAVFLANVYQDYEMDLKASSSLDFDDLLLKTYQLFIEFPEIAQKWAKKFKYVLVDEFQDTSYVQYEIIKMLSNHWKNLTVVGDPDQTIYTWREADVNLILNFDKDFPGAITVTLEQNYRSTKKILELANRLITNNKNRLPKNLFTENDEGDNISFYHAFGLESEAQWVANKIQELKKQKVQLKNIAILYRSNFYSRAFEQAFIKENIAHKILGGQRFYERPEIKDAIAYLKLIANGSENAFKRVINVPARQIGLTSLRKITEFAVSKNMTSYDALTDYFKNLAVESKKPDFKPIDLKLSTQKTIVAFFNLIRQAKKLIEKMPIHVVLKKFLHEINYLSVYQKNEKNKNTAHDNIEELLLSIKFWEQKNPDKNLNDYLEEISLLTSSDSDTSQNPHVSMMTVHISKGLEFQHVFLVGMSEGLFPNWRSLNDDKLDNDEALEEERRLAYVAVTRAKERLFLSNSQSSSYEEKYKIQGHSRFLKEMGIKVSASISEFIKDGQKEEEIDYSQDNSSLGAGDQIFHNSFGKGEILEDDGDTIVVKFALDNKIRHLLKNHKSFKKI
ncbi:ATP-dependent helicase [Candidatus Mycoplasma pogonae]